MRTLEIVRILVIGPERKVLMKLKGPEKRLLSRGLKKIGSSDVYGTVILRVAEELHLDTRPGFEGEPDAKTAIDAYRGVILPEGFEARQQ